MAQPRRDESRFGLAWGLGLSVGVHALLLLLTVVFPLVSEVRGAPPEENELVFTFTDPTPDATTDSPPLGDVPFPLPEQPPVPPAEPEMPPIEPPVDQPSVEPAEPAPLQPEPIDPVEPTDPADTAEEQPEAPEAPEADRASIPERGPGELDQPDTPEPQLQSPRRLDIGRALRDFDRALQQVPRDTAPPGRDGTPRNVYVPDLSALPRSGSAMGNLTFESRDYDWSDYGRLVYWAIWRAWHQRLYESSSDFEKWGFNHQTRMLSHDVGIRFVIRREGNVDGIAIEYESGCAPLDRSATDALAEVILPRLPDDFPRDREIVHARFIMQGDVLMLKPSLSYLKQAGRF